MRVRFLEPRAPDPLTKGRGLRGCRTVFQDRSLPEDGYAESRARSWVAALNQPSRFVTSLRGSPSIALASRRLHEHYRVEEPENEIFDSSNRCRRALVSRHRCE